MATTLRAGAGVSTNDTEPDALSRRACAHAVEWRAEQQPGTGGIHVHVDGQAGGIARRRGIAQDRLWLPEKVHGLRRELLERHHCDACGCPKPREQRSAIHLRGGRKIRAGAHGDHDELSRRLVRHHHRAVAQHSCIDRLRAVEGLRRPARITRHEIIPRTHCRAVDREPRARIELPFDERHVLEIAAGVPRGHQPKAFDLRRDIRRGFEIVFAAGQAAHHRIVRVEVQTSHEVRRRDRGLRARRLVLQRQRPPCLRAGLRREHHECTENDKPTYCLHGTFSKKRRKGKITDWLRAVMSGSR